MPRLAAKVPGARYVAMPGAAHIANLLEFLAVHA